MPWTASLPMSPPGKKSGRTTNESVVKASRGALTPLSAGRPDGRLVLERGEHVVAEAGHEEPLDQLGRQQAAAAVAEHDPVVLRPRAADRCRSVSASRRQRRRLAPRR